VPPLAGVVGQRNRPPIGRPGPVDVARTVEQLRPAGVQGLVAGEAVVVFERREQFEPRVGAVDVSDGDGAVDGDDGRRVDLLESPVERRDLGPICLRDRRCLRVDGGDRGLQLVRAGAAQPHGPVEDGDALAEQGGVPTGAVLRVEADGLAGAVGAGPPARVGEHQQRQQAERLGVVGHQLGQQPGQSQRIVAELVAHQVVAGGGGVALVVDEVAAASRSATSMT
jgi:hypothetical protein